MDLAQTGNLDVRSEWVDGRTEARDLLALLDDEELRRAERFRFDRTRVRFVARRAFARTVLAGHVGVTPATIRYRTSPTGKPELEPSCGVRFSTSHADGLAIVAVARDRLVGVDLERVRPIPDALDLAHRLFSRREYEHLRSIPSDVRSEAFLRLWTGKEACVKAIGGGLSIPLDGFDVLEPGNADARSQPVTSDGPSLMLSGLVGLAGYVGAVAVSASRVAPGLAPLAAMS